MKLATEQRVQDVFDTYPNFVLDKLSYLRKLVLISAEEIEGLDNLEETLKWGEPSYLTKYGSTIRIDWKKKKPEQYAVYFKCTSKLLPTFRTKFGDIFEYENNRAIVFHLNAKVPEEELKLCIKMAMTYHKIKHLPLLGQ
jgi:hypothetical protein